MSRIERNQISRLAEVVRSAAGVDATPLDVDELVRRLDGKIVEVADADFEAMIEKDEPGFRISLGPQHYDKRRRFSVAHELGHLFLHMGYLIDAERWRSIGTYTDSVYYRFGYNTEEYEANEFAAALLMPAPEFRAVADRHRMNGGFRVAPIADHFGVSYEAALNRGRWLGILRWE